LIARHRNLPQMATNSQKPLIRGASDPTFQRALRNAAAGLIKSLIRARAVQEPDFLCEGDYARWKVSDVANEIHSCHFLLRSVKRLRETFDLQFLAYPNSVPAPGSSPDEDSIEQLLEQVAAFIHGNLDDAIQRAIDGNTIDRGAPYTEDCSPANAYNNNHAQHLRSWRLLPDQVIIVGVIRQPAIQFRRGIADTSRPHQYFRHFKGAERYSFLPQFNVVVPHTKRESQAVGIDSDCAPCAVFAFRNCRQ